MRTNIHISSRVCMVGVWVLIGVVALGSMALIVRSRALAQGITEDEEQQALAAMQALMAASNGDFQLSGQVVDESGQQLDGVAVEIMKVVPKEMGTKADYHTESRIVNRTFNFSITGAGAVVLVFSKPGYYPKKIDFTQSVTADMAERAAQGLPVSPNNTDRQGLTIVLETRGVVADLLTTGANMVERLSGVGLIIDFDRVLRGFGGSELVTNVFSVASFPTNSAYLTASRGTNGLVETVSLLHSSGAFSDIFPRDLRVKLTDTNGGFVVFAPSVRRNMYFQMKTAPLTGYQSDLLITTNDLARIFSPPDDGTDQWIYFYFRTGGKYGKGRVGHANVEAAGSNVEARVEFRIQRDGSRNLETFEGENSSFMPPGTESPADSDDDGLSDSDESNLHGTDPGNADTDGDGISDGQEVTVTLTDPLDYYNGVSPSLAIVSGDNQWGYTNAFLTQPLVMAVTGTNGLPLGNAPVLFEVVSGGGALSVTSTGTPVFAQLFLRTGSNGQAHVSFQCPTNLLASSVITATAVSGVSTASVSFTARTRGNMAVAAGAGGYSLALRSDGSLWSWGSNGRGCLGRIAGTNQWSPTIITGVPPVTAVAAGQQHVLAVATNGTVWAWGWNMSQQLGAGTFSSMVWTPTPTLNLSNVIAVATGNDHSLALRADGSVWGWGDNSAGQLGDGTTVNRGSPVLVGGVSNVVAIAAGQSHSVALRFDGTVWAWGKNDLGQLGDGTTTSRLSAVQVNGVSNAVRIAAGEVSSIAVGDDGTVWAWGGNTHGQLGNFPVTNVVAARMTGVSNVVAYSAGYRHGIQMRADGVVLGTGRNDYGQVGDGTVTQRFEWVVCPSLTNLIMISAGDSHGLGLRSNGEVVAWGSNMAGQLGMGTAPSRRLTPTRMLDGAGTSDLSGGEETVLLVLTNGTVRAFGRNTSGQLGIGTTAVVTNGVIVSGLSNVIDIVAGGSHSAGVCADHSVWSWGSNSSGQLGDGTTVDRLLPVATSAMTNAAAVAAGQSHTLAVTVAGTVWGWGWNHFGQLGNGTNGAVNPTPVMTLGITNATQLSTRYAHSLARCADGRVRGWGYNLCGMLGDGTSVTRYTAVQALTLTNATAVAAGQYHSLALTADHRVWSWGNGHHGQLGRGTNTTVNVPTLVTNLTGISSIAAGAYHSMALTTNGTVWTWGYNSDGQIGDGSQTNRFTPFAVPGLSNITAIAAGNYFSLAVDATGEIWAWGANWGGQLNDGTLLASFVPLSVPQLNLVTW